MCIYIYIYESSFTTHEVQNIKIGQQIMYFLYIFSLSLSPSIYIYIYVDISHTSTQMHMAMEACIHKFLLVQASHHQPLNSKPLNSHSIK